MAKSIGSIYIDIEARTAKLEEGAAKAEKRVKAMQDKLENVGKGGGDALDALGWKFLKFNLYAQASANLLGALSGAMADVNNNAQALGSAGLISPQAVTALEQANVAWSKMKVGASQAYAESINFGTEIIGVLADMGDQIDGVIDKQTEVRKTLFGESMFGPASSAADFAAYADNINALGQAFSQAQRARDEFLKTPTAEERGVAAAGSAGKFEQQRAEAAAKLEAARAAASFAALQNEDKITKLRAQASAISKALALDEARSAEQQKYNSLQRIELTTREFELREAANAIEKEGKKRSLDLVRQIDVAQSRTAQSTLDSLQQEQALRDQIEEITAKGLEEKARAGKVITDDEARSLQTLADLQNRLTEAVKRRVTLEQLDAKEARDAANAAALVGLDRQERYNTLLLQAKNLRAEALSDPNADRTDEGLRQAAEMERKAREEYAQGALSDAEKLRELEATLLDLSRQNGDEAQRQRDIAAEILGLVAGYNQAMADKDAGKLLSKDQLALVERYVALTREQVQLGNKVREQALHMAELEQKKVDAAKDYLSPAQEQAAVLAEIDALATKIAANPYIKGTVMSPEQVALYDQLNEKQLRSIELLKQQKEAWRGVGQDIARTGYESALAGDKFTTVLGNMARALGDYIIQQSLIRPLGNLIGGGLFSAFGSVGWGGGASVPGKAVGGAVTSQPYLVGERGPEIFRPSGSGSIVPAKMTRQMGESAPSFSTTYNIAAGVTAAELRPILEQHAKRVEQSTRSSIMLDISRGGRRAAQFAQ